MSRDLRHDPPLPRLIFGLAVLAAGVIFLLDRTGSLEAGDVLRWWPVAAIAVGLANLPSRKWVAAAWWLLIGTYFLLPLLGIPRTPLRYILGLWPLLISAGGAALILQALHSRNSSFNAVAVMGGNVQRIAARPLRGGEAVVVMGGCEIDLTSSTLEGEATIDVLAFWGGIGLRVPREWKVVSRASLILGGLTMKAQSPPDGAPRLIVRGSAIMGGIDVSNPRETSG